MFAAPFDFVVDGRCSGKAESSGTDLETKEDSAGGELERESAAAACESAAVDGFWLVSLASLNLLLIVKLVVLNRRALAVLIGWAGVGVAAVGDSGEPALLAVAKADMRVGTGI